MSSGGDHLDPDRLEFAEFPVVRHGFEPELVRTQLAVVADEIRRLHNVVGELEREISRLEARPPDDLEPQTITEAIGKEAGRVLEAARIAAVERSERAEAEAAETIEATERAAAELEAEAEAESERIVEAAKVAADEVLEDGRDRARDMVDEARTVRERMLRDLSRKRQAHRAELEQLRAGRDRLLKSLAGAQENLDQSTAALVSAVPEAQAAAERAGLRVKGEPELTVEELEAEIAAARLVGHPLVDGDTDASVVSDPEEADALIDPADQVQADDRGLLDEAQNEWRPYDIEAEVGVGESQRYDVVADFDAIEAVEVESVDDDEAFGVVESVDDDAVAVVESVDDDAVAVDESEGTDVAVHDVAPVGHTADVDDLFARLRSSREQAVAKAEMVLAADTGGSHESPEAGEAVPQTGSADGETASDTEGLDDAVDSEVVDSDAAACADAVDEISRSLKRLVVDEQGDLLDGLRTDGVDGVWALLNDDTAYTGVLVEPLEALVVAVAGADAHVEIDGAEASVRKFLIEPVRSRVREALDDTDDPDELSTTVRAVYRECRSRRVGEAANAAVSVVYEIASGVRAPV